MTGSVPSRGRMWDALSATVLSLTYLYSLSYAANPCPDERLESLRGVWQAAYRSEDYDRAFVFNISICEKLPAVHGCEEAAVCMRSPASDGVAKIGDFNSSAGLERTKDGASKWEFRLRYSAKCNAFPKIKGNVTIEFWCGTTLGAPEVVYSDAMKCVHTIVWRTWAACHKDTVEKFMAFKETPCYVIDKDGGIIDLTPLVHTHGATLVTLNNKNYFFDLCRQMYRNKNSKNIPSQCDHTTMCSSPVTDNMTGTVIAKSTSALKYDSESGVTYLDFLGEKTNDCDSGYKVQMKFFCPKKDGEELGVIIESSSKCRLDLSWTTEHACKRDSVMSSNCSIKRHDKMFDLTPLSHSLKSGFVSIPGRRKGITYQINPCQAFRAKSPCSDVAACQIDNGKYYSLGRMDDRILRLVDGEFAMTFQHGTRCHSRLHRISVLRFQCNKTIGYGQPRYVREDDCVYLFDWPNNITCADGAVPAPNGRKIESPEPPPLCQATEMVGGEAVEYNLSPLTKEDGNWEVVTGKGNSAYTYVINVCNKIVAKGVAAKCNMSAASCQVEAGSKQRTYNTGMFRTAPTVQDGVVTLRYEHGKKCHHAGERATILRFVCSPGATTTSPVFEDELDNCTYTFQWRTAYACPVKKQIAEGCTLVDSRTGYTFNVSGLGVKSVLAGGFNFSVAACGVSIADCNKAAVCRQPMRNIKGGESVSLGQALGNLEMEHGDLRSVYSASSSDCEGGSRRVVVHYRCPPEATNFEKEAEDQHVSDGTLQVDELSLKDEKACLTDVHWYTQRACVSSPDQCVLRDAKTNEVLYDISSLSVGSANASNWLAGHTNAKSLFLINVCRPLLAVPGCHPHAAVCQVKSSKDEKRPRHYSAVINANLGMAKASTTILKKTPAGALQLTYLVSHKNSTCKTIINFVCDNQDPVGHPVFVEKLSSSPCTYVFEWHTAKGCPLRRHKGPEPSKKIGIGDEPTGNCTVSDNSGFVYNMWSLHNHIQDYVIHDPKNNKIKLRLNVCSKLIKPCAGKNKNSAVCIVDGDNQRSGGAVNKTVSYFDGTLRLVYDSGDKCPSANGLTAKTIVEFTCDHTSHKTQPSVSSSVAGCQYTVSWPTPLACQSTAVPCSVSGGGEFYDLSPLRLPHGYWDAIVPPTHPFQYLINVCGAVDDFKLDKPGNCSNGRVSACQLEEIFSGKDKSKSKTNVYSAGMTLSSPVFVKPGMLELRLASGDQCHHHHQRVRASVIQFVCDHSQTGSPEFQTEDNCEYRFLWRTRYACPLRNLTSHNCTVQDPYFPSYRYDLRKLRNLGAVEFHYENKTTKSSYDFRLLVCGPLKGDSACGDNTKAAACQLSNGKIIAAAGDYNGGLMYIDGGLELMYRQGGNAGKCHHKFVRSTRIHFHCDTDNSKGVKGTGPVMTSETSDCQYVVEWYTPLACNPERGAAGKCTISNLKTGQVYDFSSLSLSRGSWQASVSASLKTKSKFFLNLCALLQPGYAGKARPCSYKSGVCELAPNNKSFSLGQVSQLSLDNGDLIATFTGGDRCDESSSTRQTRIHFTCRHGTLGNPRLMSAEGCKYMFEWETDAACGTKMISATKQPEPPLVTIPPTRCAVESALTHTVFDLKSLKGKTYEFKDTRGMSYKLRVCGTVPDCDTKPGNPGMCQKTTRGSEWVNAGAGNGVLSYEKNLVRLVYSNGSICHHNKQRRRTVVEFYCRHDYRDKGDTGHGKPIFDNEEDCVYTVRWATDLACEKELRCSITDKETGKVFDLTQLAKYNGNWRANTPNRKGIYLINVCRALTPDQNKCPFSASSCLVNGTKALSLGHINSGSLKQIKDGTVILSYSGGSPDDTCPKGHSTTIAFHCGQEEHGPQFVENSSCEYRFQWFTPLVCTVKPKPPKVINKKCEFTDPTSGDVFNLSPLYNSKANYEVPDPGHHKRVYIVNPCGNGIVGKEDCDGADACVTGTLQGVTGRSESRSLRYDYSEHSVTMDLDGGHCVADKNWKTTITFVCAKNVKYGKPVVTFTRGCHVIFFWRTSLVCGSAPSECLLQGKNSPTIDITPLSRRSGAWHVKKDQDFFWLNLCSPVKDLNAISRHCSSSAGACWQPAHSSRAITLGYADSSHLHRALDGKAAVIEYTGGEVCKSDRTRRYRVKIVVQCDMSSGIGRPMLSSKSDCVFQFNWPSSLGCTDTQKTLAQQKTNSCGYKNALGKFVDLSDLLDSHKVVKTVGGIKYHLRICGDSPDECDSTASVCKEEDGSMKTLSLKGASHRYWHSGDDSVMIHLVSDKACDVDSSKKFEVIINLQCNTGSEKEPILDYSSSHCHYIFLWQTPRICRHLPKPVQPAPPVVGHPDDVGPQNSNTGGGGGASDLGGSVKPGSTKKAKSSVGKTVGILFLVVLILLFIGLAVVLYRSNNRLATLDRIFCFWRKRNVPSYRYRKPVLNTSEDTQLLTDGKADDSGEDDDLLAL